MKVTTATGRVLHNHLSVSSGFMSSSERKVHFGLGSDSAVKSVEIRWPSGKTQVLDYVKVDRVLKVEEPSYASRCSSTWASPGWRRSPRGGQRPGRRRHADHLHPDRPRPARAVAANVTNMIAMSRGTWAALAQKRDLAGQGTRVRRLVPAVLLGGLVGGLLLLFTSERVFRQARRRS